MRRTELNGTPVAASMERRGARRQYSRTASSRARKIFCCSPERAGHATVGHNVGSARSVAVALRRPVMWMPPQTHRRPQRPIAQCLRLDAPFVQQHEYRGAHQHGVMRLEVAFELPQRWRARYRLLDIEQQPFADKALIRRKIGQDAQPVLDPDAMGGKILDVHIADADIVVGTQAPRPGRLGRGCDDPAYFASSDLDPKISQLPAVVVVPVRRALAIAQYPGIAFEERPKPNMERVEERHPALELGRQKLKARCAFRPLAVDRMGEA